MAGRPTGLTPAVQERILAALRVGNTQRCAAELAGIGERTFYEWMARGQTGENPYAQLVQAIKEAEAESERYLVEQIRNAGGEAKQWTANAWMLERRRPKDWGKVERVELNVSQLSDADIEARWNQLVRAGEEDRNARLAASGNEGGEGRGEP